MVLVLKMSSVQIRITTLVLLCLCLLSKVEGEFKSWKSSEGAKNSITIARAINTPKPGTATGREGTSNNTFATYGYISIILVCLISAILFYCCCRCGNNKSSTSARRSQSLCQLEERDNQLSQC
ncbi:unnamed protein product [Allacma fusca]|uniref:Uncharacterized protein n=1 Tax=Allacma fusca TaxID=39272 RepID=A0A8J2JLA5_9HEXA|nr:unnamed protein product [Allacma fusca]